MDISKTLDLLDSRTRNLKNIPFSDRHDIYPSLKNEFDKIEQYIRNEENQKNHPSCAKSNSLYYILEIEQPLKALAGMEDNGHPEQSNIVRLLTCMDKLRSKIGLDIPRK